MLSLNAIEQLATRYQTDTRTVVREYIQHLFLSYLYQQTVSGDIYFKGGTALRIVYGSARFSEDLDFSATTGIIGTVSLLESAVLEALSAMSKEGIATEIVEAKQTTGGYLAIIDCSVSEMTIPLKLEISLRKGKKVGTVAMIAGDYVPNYTLVQMEESLLVGEKIAALLDRKKPRDFYDFYFLLRKNMLPAKKGEILHQVLSTLRDADINFDAELKEFLPKSHHLIIRDFRATLEREIERLL